MDREIDFDFDNDDLDRVERTFNVRSYGAVPLDFDRTEEATEHYIDLATRRGVI